MERLCINSQSVTHSVTQQGRHRAARAAKKWKSKFLISLRTLAADFKYALAWGRSTKFSPQRVGLTHEMEDEDVIMIVKK